MKQKCVQFHTSKSFAQTLKIFKKEKLEIIFYNPLVKFYLEELTIEEQISWIEANQKDTADFDRFLKKHSEKFENFVNKIIEVRKQTKELVKLYRDNPSSYKTSEKYEQMIKSKKKLNDDFNFNLLYYYWYNHLQEDIKISCSCIIAKKGTTVVRYLEFKTDPVVTITGPKAANLKSSLEKKF